MINELSNTDAKDTSLFTVYDYFQLSTFCSTSFSLHDILSSVFIVTLGQNANDSNHCAMHKNVKCVWCIYRYVYIYCIHFLVHLTSETQNLLTI